MTTTKTCSISGCEKKHYARGWCVMHYTRWRSHGDPFTMARNANGEGNVDVRGYRRVYRHGRLVYEHRAVWEEAHGPIPEGHVVHHKDGDKLNNDVSNLACMTDSEHMSMHGAENRHG